ncbi:4-oxalocrotonate tautomerase [Lucifera butyrica]|uniref:4-oxalocrotonate tautomerase n=1 Tax=Lucifera butyrica TaxID=1351585 RepID=A0A498R3N5_9FIRM|nr:4-oxalocrotonate tautomerase DmpI [Lucifera butyrica]VBB04892.1 4-oxalocrotonate tautomerase [Lucifera butyrica]
MMPVITIDGPKITREQKAKLVKKLVTKASEILNIPEQHFVTSIKENDFDNIGNGTKLLSDRGE